MHGIERNLETSQLNPNLKQKSLLSKYEIPITHLSYEYIGKCDDVKELEGIIQILRSGEEGVYPHLQKTAEGRLGLLNPFSRQLRIEEPALTCNSMEKEARNTILTDFSMWEKDISVFDTALSEENNKSEDIIESSVRLRPSSEFHVKIKTTDSNTKDKHVSNYEMWEKYDADIELLKMDLEEENKNTHYKNQHIELDKFKVVKDVDKLSEIERQVLAEQEKNRGNEYYQEKDYNEAIKYYTASIAIWPSPKAYNNRAACYLKKCKYSAALEDTNCTLALDPDDIKALFRRGIALQHKKQFREALADMNKVLKQQPRHTLAQHVAQELQNQILTLPKNIRLVTHEGLNEPKRLVEISSETLKNSDLADSSFEVNEWNLPKVMCKCTSRHKSPKCFNPQSQLQVTLKAKVSELSEECKINKASTRMNIIEVDDY